MSDQARNALSAVTVMRALGNEIGELKSEISSLLLDTTWPNGIEFMNEISSADRDLYLASGAGWVLDGWHWTYPAKQQSERKRSKPKAVGELTLAVDLGRTGWIAEQSGFPVFIVTWAPAWDSWQETLDETDFLPLLTDGIRLENCKLLVWAGEEEDLSSIDGLRDVAWMFALPLFSITGRSKIHDFILSPFVKALTGDWRAALNDVPALQLAANEFGRMAPLIVSKDPDAI